MPSNSDYIDAAGYRANVGIVLLNDQGKVFLGGRARARGYQFPQGGIQRGERAEQAVYRELGEEVGLAADQVEELGRTRGWLRYRLPQQFLRKGSLPLCIGQKQRWFLFRLQVPEEKLRFDSSDQPPEFDRWRWADWWDPVREVIYFKRQVYSRALHELGRWAYPESGLPPYPDWWEDKMSRRSRLPRQSPGAD